MATFEQLMNGFGVVTVMNAHIYEKIGSYTAVGCNSDGHTGTQNAFKPSDWMDTGEVLDTLKIANITQEGPTKTITGGQYANPLIKYGKTATMEMQDALGRASTLVRFFGCDYPEGQGRLSITDKFPGPFAIEGCTFFIDQKTGEKKWVYIFIPQFTPDAILTLTQDAEGDATVFDLNGSLGVTSICDASGDNKRDIFYEIRDNSFFAGATYNDVQITNKASLLEIDPESTNVGQFTATKTSGITEAISWSSSNADVISVTAGTGAYELKAEGKAVIIATAGDYCDSFEVVVRNKA